MVHKLLQSYQNMFFNYCTLKSLDNFPYIYHIQDRKNYTPWQLKSLRDYQTDIVDDKTLQIIKMARPQ
jgi:hypothetical protein